MFKINGKKLHLFALIIKYLIFIFAADAWKYNLMVKYNFVKDFLEPSLKNHWELRALSDYQGTSTYTYGEIAKQVHYLHNVYRTWGVKRGDKIALVGRNCANWAVTYLSAITYGAVIVPILPDFTPADLHHIVNHSDSVILFAGEMLWKVLDVDQMPKIRAFFSLTDFSVLVNNDKQAGAEFEIKKSAYEKQAKNLRPENICFPEISNSELAVISYTSGTSGFSKGVMLSFNSLAANIDYARKNMGIVEGDNVVSLLPLAHAFGCAFEFLFPFTNGCHVTFLTKIPSPQIILKSFGELKPRLILAVPLIIEKIYKKQLLPKISTPAMKFLMKVPGLNQIIFKKIRATLSDVFGGNFIEIVIGGAALNPEVESFFHKIKFHYTVGYGMTECGPLIAYSGWKANPQYSCGLPVNYCEIKIDSTDPLNDVGEILIRGDIVMDGYYKNPEANEKTFVDGWLRSGDLGILDKHGYIYIKGRSKSMILGPSGQNIYPEEIEARFNNLPYIQESLIVEHKGKLVGLIYPDYDSMKQQGMNDDDIMPVLEHHREEINKQLPQYSQVKMIKVFQQEFEKTPKRSIKRFLYQFSEN